MTKNITEFFWELFKSVSGGTGNGLTDALDALAKSNRAKLDTYFLEVIDQISFRTEDYNRLRKFLVDLFATHRTLANQSIHITDPHSLSNSNLDELFRSFGYPYSSQLKGIDENPLEQKIQFFLDLVNLYKIKGTPQSLVDVLQYYGVTEIDIFEFVLKLKKPGKLFFDGKVVAGTSIGQQKLSFPYQDLTKNDPHWLYTEQQILDLNNINKINLPSQTPYLGIEPIVDLDGIEFSILSRTVQDQYNYWATYGILPPANAEITFVGEVKSFLELYLSTLYIFNKIFSTGIEQDPCNFLCYDSTSISSVEIIESYKALSELPIKRCDLNTNLPPFGPLDPNLVLSKGYCEHSKLSEYYDIFTRSSTTNFLVDKDSAGNVLSLINPELKSALDNFGDSPIVILYSLLKDLANWVRTNIGYGFINFGFILFGLNKFFKDLKSVIEFFKPYRARLLLLESLHVRNRLFNSVIVDDSVHFDINLDSHDFVTGGGNPCCSLDSTASLVSCISDQSNCRRELVVTPPANVNWTGLWQPNVSYNVNDIVVTSLFPNKYFICTQSHTSIAEQTKPGTGIIWTSVWTLYSQIVCTDTTGINTSVYSRETFDCGSNFDIGAVTDLPKNVFIQIEDNFYDVLRCPADSTAFIVNEITSDQIIYTNSSKLSNGAVVANIKFSEVRSNTNYSIGATLRSSSISASIYNFIIRNKSTYGFQLEFSGSLDSPDYWLDWFVVDSTSSGITFIPVGSTTITVPLDKVYDSTNYVVSVVLSNLVDTEPSIYGWSIIKKTVTDFTVQFSGSIDSTNYSLEWFVCEGVEKGNYPLPVGITEITIPLPHVVSSSYPIILNLGGNSLGSSIYSPLIINKTNSNFTVKLSGTIDSTGYYIAWCIPDYSISSYEWYKYYQSSNFRDFDSEGTFDCTHGFDFVEISVEKVNQYLLQQDGFYLLQEDGNRILL